jgi:hypothetical protein
MGLAKRGNTWWMSFMYRGQQIRRSTGVKGHPNLPSSGHRKFPTRVRLSPPFPPVAPVLL